MKGIVLAGGRGTRLYPSTISLSKQLLPIYDKPLIYYPISTLVLAGIREILLVTTPESEGNFRQLLGDGRQFGIKIEYVSQTAPNGIAEVFIIAEDFIGNEPVVLILGDNLFYGVGLGKNLKDSFYISDNLIFAQQVKDPRAYGVVELNNSNEPISIEEKPIDPKSNMAVTGLYKYDVGVTKYAKILKPSLRGELEITDLNRLLLDSGKLRVNILQRGTVWLDTGNPTDMLEAGNFVRAIEERQGMKIACLEEIALNEGLIGIETFNKSVLRMQGSSYGEYLQNISTNYLKDN